MVGVPEDEVSEGGGGMSRVVESYGESQATGMAQRYVPLILVHQQQEQGSARCHGDEGHKKQIDVELLRRWKTWHLGR